LLLLVSPVMFAVVDVVNAVGFGVGGAVVVLFGVVDEMWMLLLM